MQSFELLFKVNPIDGLPLAVTFLKVPRLAMDAIGEIRIDWGDGEVDTVDCALTQHELFAFIDLGEEQATLTVKHTFALPDPTRIRITTTSGFLPLAKLPEETTMLLSPLPTLTLGETNDKGEILPTKRLPLLVPPGAEGKSALARLPRGLLEANPKITIFDEAFMGTSIRTLDKTLFSPIEHIVSLKRTFAHSALRTLPQGLLEKADVTTLCEETFANCEFLKTIENPFLTLPYALPGFLNGNEVKPFNWAPEITIRRMGCRFLSPTKNDAEFSFDWHALANEEDEQVLSFYPIDLEHHCEFYIEWGDGTRELLDCNGHTALSHTWKKAGIYTVSIHTGENCAVPPFKLGNRVVRLLSPLPAMYPRRIGSRGSLRGWAANARELESVASGFFKNNPELHDLAQCFAGCIRLKSVPEDLFEGLNALKNVDSMFAFCLALPKAPKAYYAKKRAHWLDYCAQGD